MMDAETGYHRGIPPGVADPVPVCQWLVNNGLIRYMQQSVGSSLLHITDVSRVATLRLRNLAKKKHMASRITRDSISTILVLQLFFMFYRERAKCLLP